MSDQPQGPGWWQASDGKYYPPESASPPLPPPPGPAAESQVPWPAPNPQFGSQQVPGSGPQQPIQPVVVKQGPGCLKIGLIVLAVLFVLSLLGFGCIAVVGNQAAKEIQRSTGRASASAYSLTGPQCSVDPDLGPEARGSISNRSQKKQAFQVKVRFTAPDGSLVSEDSDFTSALEPGQSTDWKVSTLKTEAPAGTTCTVSEVDYSIFD